MAGRAIRITSRIIFFVCGLISLFTAVPYVMLRGAELPVQSEWMIFVAALAVIGIFSITVSVLPTAWIARIYKKVRDDRLFALPLRVLLTFAAVGYCVAVFAYFAPHTWNLNSQVMFASCPLYFVKMTVDPSPAMVFFLLGPMNAGVYGSLGLTVAYAWMVVRARTPD